MGKVTLPASLPWADLVTFHGGCVGAGYRHCQAEKSPVRVKSQTRSASCSWSALGLTQEFRRYLQKVERSTDMKEWHVVSRRTNYFQQKHRESFKLAVFSRDGQNRWVSRAKRLLDSHHHRAWGHTGGQKQSHWFRQGSGKRPQMGGGHCRLPIHPEHLETWEGAKLKQWPHA